MLVFISDIHLTDGTTGPRNIDENDVEYFWNDIQIQGDRIGVFQRVLK